MIIVTKEINKFSVIKDDKLNIEKWLRINQYLNNKGNKSYKVYYMEGSNYESRKPQLLSIEGSIQNM